MISKILIVDPLTLLGRELLGCLEDAADLNPEVDYRHTSRDDEHQIAELGAKPALVPPLEETDDLSGFDVVVIASDVETERSQALEALLERHPEIAIVDLGGLPRLAGLSSPCSGLEPGTGGEHRLRVGHPALTAAATVIRALSPLAPVRGSLAAMDPVSTGGREAIEILAHQAARRLQGGVPEQLIDGHVLAFNQVAVSPDVLADDAASVIPAVPLAVTRTLGGCFHGHLAHLTLELPEPADDFELRELLDDRPELVLVDPPLRLDDVVDRDQVLVALPQVSGDRQSVALTLMVDGLRIGGALTAVDILRSMR